MSLLDLPGRHHPLHVLGLLAKGGELRFSQIVKQTGHFDAEVGRALDYLKRHHLVRSRTSPASGARILLVYSISARGQAAWESVQAYGQAIRDRQAILGADEVAALDQLLMV